MKPAVRVKIGRGIGTDQLPGATVRSTHTGRTQTLRSDDTWHYTFPDDKTKLYVECLSNRLSVEITNQTTVPLTLTTKLGKDELTDYLAHNKSYKVPTGARCTVSA